MLRLQYERISQQKTQADLGHQVGIPQQLVSQIERERVNPSADELERLAVALNISPPSILMKRVVVEPAEPRAEETAV